MATTKTVEVNAPAKGDETSADMVYLGGKKVRSRFTWRAATGSPEHTKDAVFDFNGCTEEQILFLAMYGAKVKVQSFLRNAANASPGMKVDPNLYTAVNVLNDVILASSKADPVASALAAARRAGAPAEAVEALAKALSVTKK